MRIFWVFFCFILMLIEFEFGSTSREMKYEKTSLNFEAKVTTANRCYKIAVRLPALICSSKLFTKTVCTLKALFSFCFNGICFPQRNLLCRFSWFFLLFHSNKTCSLSSIICSEWLAASYHSMAIDERQIREAIICSDRRQTIFRKFSWHETQNFLLPICI